MVQNQADPTNLLDTHCVFNAITVKKAGFQLGTLPGVILGSGPITLASLRNLLLMTEGNGYIDLASLRFSLLF